MRLLVESWVIIRGTAVFNGGKEDTVVAVSAVDARDIT
jgi:hypothetical protein